jgi:hypothetical protein
MVCFFFFFMVEREIFPSTVCPIKNTFSYVLTK